MPFPQPVDAMVLCAGLGTRLRPLTLERPKPAVPLLGQPLVGRAFDAVRRIGLSHVCINTHHLPEVMARVATHEASRAGLRLSISPEPLLLDTGGGLWQARAAGHLDPRAHVLILNGDVLSEADLGGVLDHHFASGADATMVLRPLPPGAGYSPVELDSDGRVRRIGPFGHSPGTPPFMFSGLHVLSPRALDLLPPGASPVMARVYAPLLEQGRVAAVVDTSRWLDLGDPAGYCDAHQQLLAGRSFVDPLARVDPSAELVRSVVGAGARVEAGARLIDTIVWEDARIPAGARLERCVVTTLGMVSV